MRKSNEAKKRKRNEAERKIEARERRVTTANEENERGIMMTTWKGVKNWKKITSERGTGDKRRVTKEEK